MSRRAPRRSRRRQPTEHRAVAVLLQQVTGVVHFRSTQDALTVVYDIRGLSDGLHGLHVHECGDMTRGCESACAHFNPRACDHGGAHSRVRHAGDLGNIASTGGRATGSVTVRGLNVNPRSKLSVVGRCLIVHAGEDDLGQGGDVESRKTGNSGARVGCAVIGIANAG
jgi:Cu-Zn family superoxide dismutase